MHRCLELAKKGLGTTYPNPLVGAVIVHEGKIIGEGYHKKAGEAHAEVIAIDSVLDKSLLQKSTIYVSLEPCAHFGKTPPCAHLIVNSKIPKVVIASKDPFAKVNGKGIQILLDAGIEVITGVLEKQADDLNKRFFTFHRKKRPYVILKWAESKDGFIAPKNDVKGTSVAISNSYSRQLSHKYRTEESAILVGTNTAVSDNPSLTPREYKGVSPTRILIDKTLKVPTDFNLYNSGTSTLVFTQKETLPENTNPNIEFIHLDFDSDIFLENLLSEMYKRDLQSVIVEGGSFTLQKFIDSKLWDQARVFTSPNTLEEGVKAPILKKFSSKKDKEILEDTLSIYLF